MPVERVSRIGVGQAEVKSVSKPTILRPPSISPRPGSNPRLVENRAVRREAARQVANQVQPARPRPIVRPAAPPVLIASLTDARFQFSFLTCEYCGKATRI